MARLIRFLSGRWTTRPTGGGPTGPKAQREGDRPKDEGRPLGRSRSADRSSVVVCRVAFLDGTQGVFDVPKRSFGSVLYEKVFNCLNIIETDYFGLQYTDELSIDCWLDSAKSIKRQMHSSEKGSSDVVYDFRFRVKFYSSDPNNLKDEITRYNFFLQLKSDVESGRLRCPRDMAFELAALTLQAELGDFDAREHSPTLVSEFRFIPNQSEDLEREILKKFKTLHGMSPERCEAFYLNRTKCLELYGVHFYQVLGKDGNAYRLGLMPKGILLCEGTQKIGLFSWPKITKLQFKKKRLLLEVIENDEKGSVQEHTFTFRLSSDRASKTLWRCAVEHHAFFRLSGPVKPYGLKSGFLRFGSRSRHSGISEAQTISRAAAAGRDVICQRRPSRRHSRRGNFEDRSSMPWSQSCQRSRNGSTSNAAKPTELQYDTMVRKPVHDDARRQHRTSTSTLQKETAQDRLANQKLADNFDNNNVAVSSFLPVQVTVSRQESFDRQKARRTSNDSADQGDNEQSKFVAKFGGFSHSTTDRRQMSPENSVLVTSSGNDLANRRSRSSVTAADNATDNGAATNNRRRRSVATDDRRQRQTYRDVTYQQPNDNLDVNAYNSMPIQRGRSREVVRNRGGEYATTNRLHPPQSQFSHPHQTIYEAPVQGHQGFTSSSRSHDVTDRRGMDLARRSHLPNRSDRCVPRGDFDHTAATPGVASSYTTDTWAGHDDHRWRTQRLSFANSSDLHLSTQPSEGGGPDKVPSLVDLLQDGAALNAELRRQMDELAKTIHEIHENELENQKLTKIKEEYKRRNAELTKENTKLKTENDRLRTELSSKVSRKLEDLNDQLARGENKIGELQKQFDYIDTQYKTVSDNLVHGEKRFNDKIKEMKVICEEKGKELEQMTNEYHILMKLQESDDGIPVTVQQFEQQKQELMQLTAKREQQRKLKDIENDALKKRIKQLVKTVENLKNEKVSVAKQFPVKLAPQTSNAKRSSLSTSRKHSMASQQQQQLL